MFLFIFLTGGLGIFIWYHWHHGHQKYARLKDEISQAQEAVRSGFMLLQQDINRELEAVRRMGAPGSTSVDEQSREQQLLRDLQEVNVKIQQEVWDIEKMLGSRIS